MLILLILAIVLAFVLMYFSSRPKQKTQNWPGHSGWTEEGDHPKIDKHGRIWCEECKGYFRQGECPCHKKK